MRTKKHPQIRSVAAKMAVLCAFLFCLFKSDCLGSAPPPVIDVQPLSQTVPKGGSVTFSVSASSGTTMSYQWYFGGSTISGATSSSYTISSVPYSKAGSYYVTVINAGGSVKSSTATLTVTNTPPVARNDGYTAYQNVTLTINISSGVLTNDTDANGDALTAVLVTDVGHGSLRLKVGGDFTYTPATDYYGNDSFTYMANDGHTNSVAATV